MKPHQKPGLAAEEISSQKESVWEMFLVFLRLGLTSFGGPIAHLGYFREEFVNQKRWLSEQNYVDLVVLCQFLPGPASSQVGMAIGLIRHGYRGAFAAWAGFTLPSAFALILFGLGIASHASVIPHNALQGLKIVAVAVVVQAIWGMGRTHCADKPRVTILAFAACMALLVPSAYGQLGTMIVAGTAGLYLFRPEPIKNAERLPITISKYGSTHWLLLFLCLLLGLPLLATLLPYQVIVDINIFFRSGALVFGGGHVVLPLLQAAVVSPGWVDNNLFLAGYGIAQAVPGPLFTFAAFLGASMKHSPSGWIGGMICLLAIFAPSFLLVAGVLPFWEELRRNKRIQSALMGVNAAVVGLLLAALYQPVWTSAIHQSRDFSMAVLDLTALMVWKFPPWLVVIGSGLAGWLFSLMV